MERRTNSIHSRDVLIGATAMLVALGTVDAVEWFSDTEMSFFTQLFVVIAIVGAGFVAWKMLETRGRI